MPYCTIEEAWQTSLNPELKMDRNYEGASELGYKNIYLEQSEIYDEKGKPIRNTPLKKIPKKKRLPNMSRTYNRLTNHSGPKSRFKDDNAQKRIVINKGKPNLDDAQKHPNYNNEDLPINDYNNSMYNTLDNEYRDNMKKLEESSMMEDFVDKNDRKRLNKLERENEELKRIIAELKNNSVDTKDNLLDLITYMFTGVVLILLLENLTKLSRKF
jgi:hypothetical protein